MTFIPLLSGQRLVASGQQLLMLTRKGLVFCVYCILYFKSFQYFYLLNNRFGIFPLTTNHCPLSTNEIH